MPVEPRHGASVYARKNDPPAMAHGAAPARVIRRPVKDRLDNQVVCDAWDESGASTDRHACGPFFDLTPRAARIAPRP